jgi:hypothetical protein
MNCTQKLIHSQNRCSFSCEVQDDVEIRIIMKACLFCADFTASRPRDSCPNGAQPAMRLACTFHQNLRKWSLRMTISLKLKNHIVRTTQPRSTWLSHVTNYISSFSSKIPIICYEGYTILKQRLYAYPFLFFSLPLPIDHSLFVEKENASYIY